MPEPPGKSPDHHITRSPDGDTGVDTPPPTRHTAIGIGLNLLLLAAIGYGYWRSESWKWAWALVAVPIAVVTITYAWHLVRGGRADGGRP
jgi:hypothetical protein